ncbi:MAG: hypothetical protein ABR536_04685 [Solirubrobacterales bacterium]
MPLLRHVDLLLLAAAAVVFIAADLPMLGFAVATGAWLASKGVQFLADRRIAASIARGERRNAIGVTAAAGLGRVWLIALAVLLVGLHDRDAGLAAAILSAVLFTTYMLTRLVIEMSGTEEGRGR